jgi:hypothetical protein
MSNPTPAYTVTVGIDWADLKHDVFERHSDGSLHHQQISSSPEAISNWLFALRSVSAEGPSRRCRRTTPRSTIPLPEQVLGLDGSLSD